MPLIGLLSLYPLQRSPSIQCCPQTLSLLAPAPHFLQTILAIDASYWDEGAPEEVHPGRGSPTPSPLLPSLGGWAHPSPEECLGKRAAVWTVNSPGQWLSQLLAVTHRKKYT